MRTYLMGIIEGEGKVKGTLLRTKNMETTEMTRANDQDRGPKGPRSDP